MVPGSWLPLTIDGVHPDGVLTNFDPESPSFDALTVEVDIPDRLLNPISKEPDIGRIRELYRGNPDWDNEARQLNI